MRAARRLAWIGLLAAAFPGTALAITGICPDGSIFIVKSAADVPCPDAKRVRPDEVPPIKAEYLPRPYAWEVFHARQDPNNPYNLIDAARRVREDGGAPDDPAPQGDARPLAAEAPTPAPERAATPAPAPTPEPLFSAAELRDLDRLVELSQRRAPAAFRRPADAEAPALTVQLAHSRAFEERLRVHFAARGEPLPGSVLLFRALATAPEPFFANFTFAQGSWAHHPERDDPRQLGVLAGRLGELTPGEGVVGYAVLPPGLSPEQPLDVYWNDHLLVTTLRPAAPQTSRAAP